MGILLKVYGLKGEERIIDLCDNEEQLKKITVRQLREKITKELQINGDLRLVFRAESLEEDELLVSYGIRHMDTIYTLLRLLGGGGHPWDGHGGMGDKEGKNRSMDRLFSL